VTRILALLPLLLLLGSAAPPPITLRDYARVAQAETGIPAALTLAVAIFESGGDMAHPPALCANGTYDLGPGLNSRWLPWFEECFNAGRPINPSSPESLLVVARILRWNLDTFGDEDMALTAYRWGQRGAREHGPDYWYISKVRAWL
jgi:hypothetical protein